MPTHNIIMHTRTLQTERSRRKKPRVTVRTIGVCTYDIIIYIYYYLTIIVVVVLRRIIAAAVISGKKRKKW